MADFFSPGEVAEHTGFSLDTLRYYERIGLLNDVGRDGGGRRRFSQANLDWLDMLRYLRDTGMPIQQLRLYTELTEAGEETIRDRMELLVEHEERVSERIEQLGRQRERIRQKIGWYREQLETTAATPAARR